MKTQQVDLLRKHSKSYGGELLKTRKGRLHGRPLSTQHTMHLVLRSSKAKGVWSFRQPRHLNKINLIVKKFSLKYGVQVISLANVGNHLHFHLKLNNRFTYRPFIRAITAAIMMAVTGASRWRKMPRGKDEGNEKFWDYRPFTRVVDGGRKAFLALKDYIHINRLEGFGYRKQDARFIIKLFG